MNTLIEWVGWYGATAILLAYLLLSFGVLASDSVWFQLLNGTGALGILAVSWYRRAYQPAVLNALWAAIAIVALVRMALSL